MRALVKNVAEAVLHGSGLVALARARRRSDVLILGYHNVVPDDHEPSGDRSLHLPLGRFAEHLDELERHADVVPLLEALGPATRRDRPAVAITFDDAYRGAVGLGVGELVGRGLPATIFACPGRLDGHAFWWDRLAGQDSGFRDTALEACRGREELIEPWAADLGVTPVNVVPRHMTSASAAELHAVAGAPGITIGAHTWSHPNLARATAEELEVELGQAARWLRDAFPESFVPVVAYPYGLSDRASEARAAEVGYEAGLRIEGGWFRAGEAPAFRVPRLNVPAGLSRRGFGIRLAGLLAS